LEKEGVIPDIFIEENFKDSSSGNPPQLERATKGIEKQVQSK
jgi:C-terminal processing protease CtpA/Prc